MIERTETLSDVVVGVLITTTLLGLGLVYVTYCLVVKTKEKIFNIIKKGNNQIER